MTMYPTITTLRPGDAGTDDTLQAIVRMARQGAATNPFPRTVWSSLTPDEQVRALRDFLRHHVTYQDDPPGVELVRHPLEMLTAISRGRKVGGDCDDIAALGAMLALGMGLRARLVAVAFAPDAPFAHVWTEVSGRRGEAHWLDLDVTRPEAVPEGTVFARTAVLPVG